MDLIEKSDRAGARTQGPRLKRALLYQLSYSIFLFKKFGKGKVVFATYQFLNRKLLKIIQISSKKRLNPR